MDFKTQTQVASDPHAERGFIKGWSDFMIILFTATLKSISLEEEDQSTGEVFNAQEVGESMKEIFKARNFGLNKVCFIID